MATEVGTAFKQDFIQLRKNAATSRSASVEVGIVDLPNICCFELPAFAESIFTNEFNNDKHGYLYFWPLSISSASLKLQKIGTDGLYFEVLTFSDSSLGTFYPFGFQSTDNIFDDKAIGVELDWALVLAAHGAGTYRVVSLGFPIVGVAITRTQLEFCLQEWSEDAAATTVRIDWILSGNVGSIDRDDEKWDYGSLQWFNQLRLPESQFGEDISSKESEYNKYQNGKKIWLKDSNVKNYVLRTNPLPVIVHKWIDDNLRFGDEILITDFNPSNPTPHIDKSVISTGGYEPEWQRNNLKARVEMTFEQAFQNHNHKRC